MECDFALEDTHFVAASLFQFRHMFEAAIFSHRAAPWPPPATLPKPPRMLGVHRSKLYR